MHIQISLGIKFLLKLTLLKFLDQINTKTVFPNKNKKINENYHPILHIQIKLDSKIQSQQTILIFGTNFQTKVYFRSKNKKIKKISIEFFMFELV